MKTFRTADFEEMERRLKGSLINYLSGAKSANLIGTKSKGGDENLALFSSVVHLGAHPPLLGFIMRPVHVARHTYENILDTGHFSINAVNTAFQQSAHQSSARYPREVSEFEACGLRPFYESEFPAPFVQESPLRMGCTLEDDLHIKSNDTRLIVGRITILQVEESILRADGSIDLHAAKIAAITGLDSWHALGPPTRYPYAKPDVPFKHLPS